MEESNSNQTIIIKSGTDDQRHFTFGDFLKQVFKFKFWILGFILICLILGYLFVYLYLSPKRETYIAGATLHMPLLIEKNEDDETTSITYLNGSSYSMYDIISEDNINRTIQSTLDDSGNRKYGSLNATQIVEDNAITIALQPSLTDSTVLSDPGECSYTLTLKASAFPNIRVASSFVNDLLQTTVNYAISLIPTNHVTNLLTQSDYLMSTTLDNEIDILLQQYDAIFNCYTDLLSNFQGAQYSSNGQNLTEIYNNFINSYQSQLGYPNIFDDLHAQLVNNSYFRYIDSEDGINDAIRQCQSLASQYISRMNNDQKQIESYQNSLNSVNQSTIQASSDALQLIMEWNQSILDLQSEINELKDEVTALGYKWIEDDSNTFSAILYTAEEIEENPQLKGTYQYLQDELAYLQQTGSEMEKPQWGSECQEFSNAINDYIDDLVSDLNQVNAIYHNVYQNNLNSIVYNNSSVLVSEGHISGFIGAIAGFIGSILIAAIVIAVYGYSQMKKEEALETGVKTSQDKVVEADKVEEKEQTTEASDEKEADSKEEEPTKEAEEVEDTETDKEDSEQK